MSRVEAELTRKAAEAIRAADRIAVLTGAGVSKESGIPTFRDAQVGLWANYDPERLATPEGFLADPPLVWQWYDSRREKVRDVQPNAGHYAIVELAKKKLVTVITQNVDGLHQRAGSIDVIELHGNITSFVCFDKRHPQSEEIPLGLKEPSRCHCGSKMRPAVVWFGEALPPGVLNRALECVEKSDVVIVAGTSGIVQPAASLPFSAKRAGATVIEVNPQRTPISDIADLFLGGPSGEVLPRIVEML